MCGPTVLLASGSWIFGSSGGILGRNPKILYVGRWELIPGGFRLSSPALQVSEHPTASGVSGGAAITLSFVSPSWSISSCSKRARIHLLPLGIGLGAGPPKSREQRALGVSSLHAGCSPSWQIPAAASLKTDFHWLLDAIVMLV